MHQVMTKQMMSEMDEIFAKIDAWLDDEICDEFGVPSHAVNISVPPSCDRTFALVDKINVLYRKSMSGRVEK